MMPHGTEEAWTFEKTVELTVPAGRCDTVEIIAPTGSTIVSPIRERIRARISLEPGENVIEAECHKDGSLNGKPPKQRAIRTMLLKGMGVTSNAALSRRTTI